MTQSESVQVFIRSLNQRYSEFQGQLEGMLQAMSSNDGNAKITSSRVFLTTASGLALTLATSDRPDWLKELIDCTEWYVGNTDNPNANHHHTLNIFKYYDQAMHHEWSFGQQADGLGYSFDELYEMCREDSKVFALFDTIVDTLNLMIDSCEIDSVSAISNLNQLVYLIEQNSPGSYFSVFATRDFMSKFMKNGTWMQIRKIPGVKNYKDAFEKTTKELDAELDKLHKDMVTEIQNRFDSATEPRAHKHLNRKLVMEMADAM